MSIIDNLVATTAIAIVVVGCSRVELPHEEVVPISRDKATQVIEFPLVGSATNIFFYEDVSGLQSLERLVRFDVSVQDSSNQLSNIINYNNQQLKRTLPYSKTTIDPERIPIRNKLPWWTPNKIKKGYYAGEMESYAYRIWVDEDTQTFYIKQTD